MTKTKENTIIEKSYELIKFEDGDFSLDVNVSPSEDTVWLNRNEISLLFDRDIKTISKHINNALNEECKNSTVAKFAIVQLEGNRYVEREISYYNLEVIISVGYRVKSERGIIFRRWAHSILKQYLLKGYVVNEPRCMAHSDSLIQINNTINDMNDRLSTLEIKYDNLKRMSQLAASISIEELRQQVVAQIGWSHLITILQKTKTHEELLWYIQKTYENGWSRSILLNKIKMKSYELKNIDSNNEVVIYGNPIDEMFNSTLVFDFIDKNKIKRTESINV